MTSKQALEMLMVWATNDYIGLEPNSDEYKELYNTIKADLEILEILKMWSFLDTGYKESTKQVYDEFVCRIHTIGMKEDYNKVKEWLKK